MKSSSTLLFIRRWKFSISFFSLLIYHTHKFVMHFTFFRHLNSYHPFYLYNFLIFEKNEKKNCFQWFRAPNVEKFRRIFFFYFSYLSSSFQLSQPNDMESTEKIKICDLFKIRLKSKQPRKSLHNSIKYEWGIAVRAKQQQQQ